VSPDASKPWHYINHVLTYLHWTDDNDNDDDDHDSDSNSMLIIIYLPEDCDDGLSTDAMLSFCIVTTRDDKFLSTTASDTTHN